MEEKKNSSPAKRKKKKQNKIGKPPAWLYYPAICAVSLVYRIKYNVHVDRSAFRGEKGPAVVLAPHLSNSDHVFTSMAVFPRRPTFVLSEHFRTTKFLRFLLEYLNMIFKKMFCPDSRSVIRMIRAIKEGNTLVLFPEGRLTWYGRSLAVTSGTSELIKQLGAPVYTVTSDGAGRTFPKWAKYKRRGRINVVGRKLLSSEEISAMSIPEIGERIASAIQHDEEKVLPGTRFRAKDTTAGLDGIVWVCPSCGARYSLDCSEGHVRCRECGFDAVLDEYGKLSGGSVLEEKGISGVADFYGFCASSVNISEPLRLDVTVSGTDSDGYMKRGIGKGVFTISREGFAFEGELDGRPDSFFIPENKIAGFPITVGDHVDLYRDGRLLWIEPSPDRRRAIELAAYLEKMHGGKNTD